MVILAAIGSQAPKPTQQVAAPQQASPETGAAPTQAPKPTDRPAPTQAPMPTDRPAPTAAPEPTTAPTAIPIVATEVPAPTTVPTPPTVVAPATEVSQEPVRPDYVKLRQELILPLGALIVATRNKSPTAAQHLADFNVVAERVLPAIATDMSVNANRLHSVIVNVRDAAARKDLATLERERISLLEVH